MSEPNFTKKRKTAPKPSTSHSFQWTPDHHLQMAYYFRDNYQQYKKTERGAKVKFFKSMKETLQLKCNDQQMKNGFNTFYKKYTGIRKQLNDSGFGIDPAKDATLDKGWILKQCPYFNILDEFLSTRPNIVPPVVLQSSNFGEIGAESEISAEPNAATEPHVPNQDDEQANSPAGHSLSEPEYENDGDIQDVIMHDGSIDYDIPDDEAGSAQLNSHGESSMRKLHESIGVAFSGIGVAKRKAPAPKTALGAFSEFMQSKMSDQRAVDEKKIELETIKFEFTKEQEKAKLELQEKQFESQMELEKIKVADAKDHREFELAKLDKQVEIRRLELAIALENGKSSGTSSNPN